MGGDEQIIVADGPSDALERATDHAVVPVRRFGQWKDFDSELARNIIAR